jgi:hypothetical protein
MVGSGMTLRAALALWLLTVVVLILISLCLVGFGGSPELDAIRLAESDRLIHQIEERIQKCEQQCCVEHGCQSKFHCLSAPLKCLQGIVYVARRCHEIVPVALVRLKRRLCASAIFKLTLSLQ